MRLQLAASAGSTPVALSALVLDYQSTTASGNTGNVALTGAVPLGSLLIVTVTNTIGPPTVTLTDSLGHTWTSSTLSADSFAGRASIFWTITTVAMSTSDWVRATASSSNHAWKVQARYATGFDPGTPVSGVATETAATATTGVNWSPNIDTATTGDAILFVVGINVTTDWAAIPSGFTSEKVATNSSPNFTALTGYRVYSGAIANQPADAVLSGTAATHQGVAIRIKAAP